MIHDYTVGYANFPRVSPVEDIRISQLKRNKPWICWLPLYISFTSPKTAIFRFRKIPSIPKVPLWRWPHREALNQCPRLQETLKPSRSEVSSVMNFSTILLDTLAGKARPGRTPWKSMDGLWAFQLLLSDWNMDLLPWLGRNPMGISWFLVIYKGNGTGSKKGFSAGKANGTK